MKNFLLLVGGVAVAYALYKRYMETSELKKEVVRVNTATNEAIVKAMNNLSFGAPQNNWQTFNAMLGQYNADISKTVAPSVNAKIGIF